MSQINELVRQLFAGHIQAELAERPDLIPTVMPDYPPFSKRFIRDNGAWPRTIMRDDVALVTEAIDEITPEGVRTADGALHEADVLIYGTGFTASDFLMPMRVVGRDGVELHDRWQGDARAYLGITLPGFPNLFLLYGPNTNIVVNGSITYFSECEVHYVLGCVRALLARGRPGTRAQGRGPRRLQRRGSTPRTSTWPGASRRSTPGTRTPPAAPPRTGRSASSSTGS